MIDWATGTTLVPGNGGKNCPGNGETKDANGDLLECCCEECDYYLCCMDENIEQRCLNCSDYECEYNKTKRKWPFSAVLLRD